MHDDKCPYVNVHVRYDSGTVEHSISLFRHLPVMPFRSSENN